MIKVEPADRSDYTQSVIVDYGTYKKTESLKRVCDVLGVSPSLVQKQNDPNSTVDFLVILGSDYDPCNMR